VFLAGAYGLAAAIAWSAWGTRRIDDDIVLLGFPLGAVLGVFAARATVRRRAVHRTLVVLGVVAAAAGIAGAMSQFAASTARHGEGPFSGLS
jgi:fermentation-respiration switch protein FrsA (DUF1100 family)